MDGQITSKRIHDSKWTITWWEGAGNRSACRVGSLLACRLAGVSSP